MWQKSLSRLVLYLKTWILCVLFQNCDIFSCRTSKTWDFKFSRQENRQCNKSISQPYVYWVWICRYRRSPSIADTFFILSFVIWLRVILEMPWHGEEESWSYYFLLYIHTLNQQIVNIIFNDVLLQVYLIQKVKIITCFSVFTFSHYFLCKNVSNQLILFYFIYYYFRCVWKRFNKFFPELSYNK